VQLSCIIVKVVIFLPHVYLNFPYLFSYLPASFVILLSFQTTLALNSLLWLPIQQRINFKLTTLVHRSLHNAGPQYLSPLLHPYTPSRRLHSASLNLFFPTSYQHYYCLSWFWTCWPFPLEFPPSSSQIYRHLHCLQIQSKNSKNFSLVHASLAPSNFYPRASDST